MYVCLYVYAHTCIYPSISPFCFHFHWNLIQRRADNFAGILALSLSLHTPLEKFVLCFAFACRPICIDLGWRLAANCKCKPFKWATSCCSPGKLSTDVCVCVCVLVLHTRTTTTLLFLFFWLFLFRLFALLLHFCFWLFSALSQLLRSRSRRRRCCRCYLIFTFFFIFGITWLYKHTDTRTYVHRYMHVCVCAEENAIWTAFRGYVRRCPVEEQRGLGVGQVISLLISTFVAFVNV